MDRVASRRAGQARGADDRWDRWAYVPALGARILDYLADTGVPAPQLLAVDRSVGAGRHAVLVQTLLRGDVSLPATPTNSLLAAQVSTIRAFQDVPLAHWLSDRAAARWAQVNVGVFGDVAEREAFLVERLRQLRHTAPMTPVFVHDDYWIGNTLRTGDHVVGVVDWGEAGRGSAARDATYCAVDMRLCYGVDVGDRFLAMFREQVDLPDEEVVAWDARAVLMARFYRSWLVGWNGLGVPVTCEAASERRAELLDRVRSRLR